MALVMAGMLFFHAAALHLADPSVIMSSFSYAERIDLAGLMLHVHNSGVWIWQLFFALHLSILGFLVVRSGRFPALLGYGMTIGAAGYLADSIYAFAFSELVLLGHLRVGLLAIVTLSEVGFALWLLLRGQKDEAETRLLITA